VGAGRFPTIIASVTLVGAGPMIVVSLANLLRGNPKRRFAVHRPAFVLATSALLIAQRLLFEVIGALACIAIFAPLIMLAAGDAERCI